MSTITNEKKGRGGFLSRRSVAQRIYFLVLVPLVLLLLIGVGSIFALNQNEQALLDARDRITAMDAGNKLIRRTQRDYLILLHEVSEGSVTWASGLKRLDAARQAFIEITIPRYKVAKGVGIADALPDPEFSAVLAEMDRLVELMLNGRKLLEQEDRNALELYLLNDLEADTAPFRDAIHQQVQNDLQQTYDEFDLATTNARNFLLAITLATGLGMLLAALLGFIIYRSISFQVSKLTGTIRDISAGDLNARVEFEGKNELVELGDAFDGMVEERIVTQRRINEEHEQLNDSVFSLLEAVADLSDRNLTVRAVVTEDATGPLADAINQLAEDTGETLLQVRDVAELVESTSADVNQHALAVNKLSELERAEAEETMQQVAYILKGLNSIAKSAQQADSVANITSATTRSAQESVARMLNSIAGIRDNVQETGKRLKRLGERSQEISRIVDIINTISERTTVLALNANMQATAAGEAGRGFSVIAEEIQHLSESSRESTEQIGVLVRNIQQEANTTMTNMDETISEVVGGSTLAEQAAEQMDATLEATTRLVTSVGKIATDSADQAAISHELQGRAERIVEATQTTGKELLSLTGLTRNMASYGQRLAQAVKVFKLER
ncbi:MAG: Methyl-accepting chemotaxis protein [uncultured Thiotrichaceae bacterium]|uniref:Methyl-accepting chemotaxis protein n=1 Tax=uncultured Thiotrichaceae bacterium TaxID=298394 RepID=A0A6S6UCH8_9GAMM|nr:MAG: Methyl-accepting chemotaxis protein [uncultured Thiotrichaceae bacterium]